MCVKFLRGPVFPTKPALLPPFLAPQLGLHPHDADTLKPKEGRERTGPRWQMGNEEGASPLELG